MAMHTIYSSVPCPSHHFLFYAFSQLGYWERVRSSVYHCLPVAHHAIFDLVAELATSCGWLWLLCRYSTAHYGGLLSRGYYLLRRAPFGVQSLAMGLPVKLKGLSTAALASSFILRPWATALRLTTAMRQVATSSSTPSPTQ